MHILVLSDTHAPRRWKDVPDGLREPLARADVILHAGDVCTVEGLDVLTDFAPTYAVLGNNDRPEVAAWGAPKTLELERGGIRLAMIHDRGPRQGRGRRMRRLFPDAELVVFGHSHIPYDAVEDGIHLFNPGSPTDRRRQPVGTYGELEVIDGRLVRHEIVPLPSPSVSTASSSSASTSPV